MTDEELDRIDRAEEIQWYTENRCEALEKENRLAKSLLYCTKGTCDNCGFVNCENFQMQRKSEPCALYISYKDRIKRLEQENDVLIKSYNKLNKAKEIFQEYIRINLLPPIERNFDDEVKLFKQAEEFLKEEENDSSRTS